MHGYDVTTEILAECKTAEELKIIGEYYSQLFNVVDDPLFANLRIESGDGGDTSQTPAYKSYMQTDKPHRNKNKTYEEIHGDEKAKELRRSRIQSNINRGCRNDVTKFKISNTRKERARDGTLNFKPPKQDLVTCPHCGTTTTFGNAHRWHLDRCRIRY